MVVVVVVVVMRILAEEEVLLVVVGRVEAHRLSDDGVFLSGTQLWGNRSEGGGVQEKDPLQTEARDLTDTDTSSTPSSDGGQSPGGRIRVPSTT